MKREETLPDEAWVIKGEALSDETWMVERKSQVVERKALPDEA